MFFKYATILLIAGLIGVHGAAVDGRTNVPRQDEHQELVLFSNTTVAEGTLTIWSVPDNGTTPEPGVVKDEVLPLQRRCGSNSPVICDGGHQAYNSVCSALVNSLSNAGVSTSPRSICLTQSGNQCCISWGNAAPGMLQNYLRGAANTALGTCGGTGLVSAIVRDVNLSGVCTNQCLSNRPNDCPGA